MLMLHLKHFVVVVGSTVGKFQGKWGTSILGSFCCSFISHLYNLKQVALSAFSHSEVSTVLCSALRYLSKWHCVNMKQNFKGN